MTSLNKTSAQPFTPDDQLDLLFSADLIPTHVKDAMHPDVHIRPLASTDFRRGHLSILSILTSSPDPGEAAWIEHFNILRSTPDTYYSLVIIDKQTDQIIGLGTVFMEFKFQRGVSLVGHIEDIVVDQRQQGKKLGLRIIQALTSISESKGAYKTILNCNEGNIPFYEKCGYEKKEIEMVKYTPERSHTPRL